MRESRSSFRNATWVICIAAVCLFLVAPSGAAAEEDGAAASEPASEPIADTIELQDYLVLPAVGHYGRLSVHQDALEAQWIGGQWQPPAAGDTVSTTDGGAKTWRAATAAHGSLDTKTVRGGYAFAKFDSPTERVMLLAAAGHATVYVNGEPRAGDPYRLGWLRLPVRVKRGENSLLFHVASEQLTARLTTPPGDVFFLPDDRTLPTLVRGEAEPVWGAMPLVNATHDWLGELQLECRRDRKSVV